MVVSLVMAMKGKLPQHIIGRHVKHDDILRERPQDTIDPDLAWISRLRP